MINAFFGGTHQFRQWKRAFNEPVGTPNRILPLGGKLDAWRCFALLWSIRGHAKNTRCDVCPVAILNQFEQILAKGGTAFNLVLRFAGIGCVFVFDYKRNYSAP